LLSRSNLCVGYGTLDERPTSIFLQEYYSGVFNQ